VKSRREVKGVVHLAGGQQKYLLQPTMPQLNVPSIVAAIKAAASSAKNRTPTPSLFLFKFR
jgi:hypothetical protein